MSTTLTRLLPLLLLLILLSIIGFITYATYTVATAVKTQTEKRMEKKHVVVTKEGMRVGVKEVGREGYVDRTQSILVQAWNFSSWTGGWWGQQQQQEEKGKGKGERRRGSAVNMNGKKMK